MFSSILNYIRSVMIGDLPIVIYPDFSRTEKTLWSNFKKWGVFGIPYNLPEIRHINHFLLHFLK